MATHLVRARARARIRARARARARIRARRRVERAISARGRAQCGRARVALERCALGQSTGDLGQARRRRRHRRCQLARGRLSPGGEVEAEVSGHPSEIPALGVRV